MTKPWDLHEATIKKLYAEKTLSQVRKIMIEKYNFKASTRSYRGRLDKWGVRKYNCRRRSDVGSESAGSQDGSVSGSDITSPTLSRPDIESCREPAPYHMGRQQRDSDPGMSNLSEPSYNGVGLGTSRYTTEHYNRDRPLISPTQEMQYTWNLPPTQPASSQTIYGHTNIVATPGSVYSYPPLSPTSTAYAPAAYEPDQAAHDRQRNYPPIPARQYASIYDGPSYSARREYGHEHPHTGMGGRRE